MAKVRHSGFFLAFFIVLLMLLTPYTSIFSFEKKEFESDSFYKNSIGVGESSIIKINQYCVIIFL